MTGDLWSRVLPPSATWRSARAGIPVGLEPVAHGTLGAPLWPKGLVGSVTRGGGRRTVALAPRDRVGALGIDMEALIAPPPAAWSRLLDDGELGEIDRLPPPERGRAVLALWCMKESLFKALAGRLPLESLALRHADGRWRPAASLAPALALLGVPGPAEWILESMADGGWLGAAAWYQA